jgi:hypothetical protein
VHKKDELDQPYLLFVCECGKFPGGPFLFVFMIEQEPSLGVINFIVLFGYHIPFYELGDKIHTLDTCNIEVSVNIPSYANSLLTLQSFCHMVLFKHNQILDHT